MNFASTQGMILFRQTLQAQSGRKDLGTWTARLIAVGSGFAARIRHRRAVHRTRKSLSALDDKGLADLGLYRDQIGLVARQGCLPEWEEMQRGSTARTGHEADPLVLSSRLDIRGLDHGQ